MFAKKTVHPSLWIHFNKIKNRIRKIEFKIKTGYYLKLLIPELMKLLESTKSKITKDENDENVLQLGITEVVLVHCNNANNDYQQDSRVLSTFIRNKWLGQLLDISLKNFIKKKKKNQNFHMLKYGLVIKVLNC